MLVLEENARLVATDSGGVQREAYYLGVPCITLRDETEWIATVDAGWNILVGADQNMILDNWFTFAPPVEHPAIYGDGSAAQQIAENLNAVPIKLHKRDPILENRLPALDGEIRK
jgi:UDP-GlcNAc3NAcA epimerase